MSGLEGFAVRNVASADWDRVTAVLVEWWDGRDLSDLLPRLFFQHFCTTSWLVERDGELAAFLVGFLCPTHEDEAYIHFVGVAPELRGRGLAQGLYGLFFDVAQAQGRSVVRAITSPVNKVSIAFHSHIGFVMLPGDGEQDGLPIWLDYDGPGQHRVRLERRLR
jgi:predicted GNAT superfamily acetyltransferase